MFVYCGSFRFFWGIQITPFRNRSEIDARTESSNFLPIFFLKVIWIVLCANWMFSFLRNHFWFWCLSSIILSAIATVKEVKTEMCFKLSIGLSHPIYEIATSHVWSFKRLETRVFKNQILFLSRKWGHSVIYSGCQTVEWLQ